MMEEHEINHYQVNRYLHAVVSLYSQSNMANRAASQLADAAAASKKRIAAREKSPVQERKLMILELKAKVRKITSEIQNTKVSSPADRKQLRKIEARLDIYKSRLDKLEKQAG